MIADARERELARSTERSVIVQAPAGSGKTELLMQRYLALLAQVDEPETILAVTFTRKAAAEMRQRVLAALRPRQPEQRLPETAALADAVLAQDAARGWRLLDYPARLRIRTFDSVNSWLASSAPVSDQRGAALGAITERTDELYALAARRTLDLLAEPEYAASVATVLAHLDNRADRFISLMAQMLYRRDQWLPMLASGELGPDARELLESGLRALVVRELRATEALLTPAARADLAAALPAAAAVLKVSKPTSSLCAWDAHTAFPAASAAALPLWRAVADFALVQTNSKGPQVRSPRGVNKTLGFPTPKDGGDPAINATAKALVEDFAAVPELAAQLDRVRALPDPAYTDEQWAALVAMIRVLPLVAAELELVFNTRGVTDYIQIARHALDALGSADDPSRLALQLDYQIQHILIDEFQDTSRTQLQLLEQLTSGWTGSDGRTLMLVGDPMQSIYRFRQADVSLFLRLWEQGLGDLRLEPITLSTNFRSAPAVVEWVNQTFAALLPPAHDQATGAVRFAPGAAAQPVDARAGVHWHYLAEPARVDEAAAIAELVYAALKRDPSTTVGILVRTRHQARLIAPALRALDIAFAGAGLEQPAQTAVEQDLLALTRALSHRADRTAWLALLRGPWCGLSLADLEALCGRDWQRPVWDLLHDAEQLAGLSADGHARAVELRERLGAALARQGRQSLRDWIEGAWQQLDGPALLTSPRELLLAAQFFARLDEYDAGGDIAAAFLLHERLAEREDDPQAVEARVHLLTLFKAKGLEYDVVILPALDGITRQDDRQALAWHELNSTDSASQYLLAPVEPTGDAGGALQNLMRQYDREQAAHERDRLLYVATTRAKSELHLFCELKRNTDGDVAEPRTGSLLERLWPVCGAACREFDAPPGTAERREQWVQPLISRRPANWSAAPPPVGLASAEPATVATGANEVSYEWASSDAMRVGTVVHRCLQHMAEAQQPDWQDAAAARAMLVEEGVAEAGLGGATEQVMAALRVTCADARGQWLLAAHQDAASEQALMVSNGTQLERVVIDRTFIADDGVRWVIDYKTSSHEGGNLEGFLQNELVRYREQLERYRAALQALEPEREVRVALYFPLLAEFRELRD